MWRSCSLPILFFFFLLGVTNHAWLPLLFRNDLHLEKNFSGDTGEGQIVFSLQLKMMTSHQLVIWSSLIIFLYISPVPFLNTCIHIVGNLKYLGLSLLKWYYSDWNESGSQYECSKWKQMFDLASSVAGI